MPFIRVFKQEPRERKRSNLQREQQDVYSKNISDFL